MDSVNKKKSSGNRTIVEQFWDKEWKMPGGLTLSGYSRAADRTGFSIRELGVFLDAGVSSYQPPKYCFITHCHADHCFQLPMLMIGSQNMNIYLPEIALPFVDRHIESTFCMNKCSNSFNKSWYKLNPICPGDSVQIECCKTNRRGSGRIFNVTAIAMDHNVPSLGYTFSEVRTRLNTKFSGLDGKQLASLRKQGVEISEQYETPMFVFMGDTSIHGLLDHENTINKFPVVVVECTFLQKEHRGEGKDAKKHICWEELLPVIQRTENDVTWILIHFSMRYNTEELKTFFDDQFSELDIKNVIAWI
jgi:ribonuclease Z